MGFCMDRCGVCDRKILDGHCCSSCGGYTCADCLEERPSKGIVLDRHKCPHCNEWAFLEELPA